MKYMALLNKMTLREKIELCEGDGFWRTKAYPQYGIPSVLLYDGPHGLRKAYDDGSPGTQPATCFPTACATACSWDRGLLREVGAALGKEGAGAGVGVILGPGINIKRNPLCGRNFEYFSEDPLLAGELGGAMVVGMEEYAAASLKHYAANSQETRRFTSDSVVDERALREIYLAGFERAIQIGHPRTIMGAYNKVNGTYSCEHPHLISEILREEWGYDGVVMTDWGAMSKKSAAFAAGTDLEMPGGQYYFVDEAMRAVEEGRLSEEAVNRAADRMLELVFSLADQPSPVVDYEAHHQLARKAAAQSAVLLKNEGVLPLAKDQSVALIGRFAREPRYQGAGSSLVNPYRLTSAVDAFGAENVTYCDGYEPDGSTTDQLIDQAVQAARSSQTAVVFAGLPVSYESEGFDRDTLELPAGHNRLIREVAAANPRTVVVLMAGGVMLLPWLDDVSAVLHLYLPGEAGGEAAYDLLTGAVNPSGKLAESYPLTYEDVPSASFYAQGELSEYRESIFVGYRYYQTAKKAVRFPFGYGLSYTTFTYETLIVETSLEKIHVSLTVRNVGDRAGAETVQLYISAQTNEVRPERELKGFEKIYLEPGQTEVVQFTLDRRAFAYYDTAAEGWQVTAGEYTILVGSSSQEIRLTSTITLDGAPERALPEALRTSWYTHLQGQPPREDFETLLGRKNSVTQPIKGRFTVDNTILEMQSAFVMRVVLRQLEKANAKVYGSVDYTNPTFRMVMHCIADAPIRSLCQITSGKFSKSLIEGLVCLANGHYIQGLKALIQKERERLK